MGALLIVDIEWHYGLIQPLLNPISTLGAYPPSLHIFTHSQQTAGEKRHAGHRGNGVSVIPQVAEERKGEEFVVQIALVHRRYVLGAGAEFKKLVFKDEQSI